MRKHLKMIMATVMAMVMIATCYVPSMAAEKVTDVENTVVEPTVAQNVDATRAFINEFHYTGHLTAGKVLGSVTLSTSAASVQWTVGRTGASGAVNIEITNTSTGEKRLISAYANNTLQSMTWAARLPAGTWEVSIIFVSNNNCYDVDLYFYS